MKVGFDCDGVLYDFADSVRQYLIERYGWPLTAFTPPVRWGFYEDWGLSLDDFLAICNDGVNYGVIFNYGEPHFGSFEAIREVREAGHSTHLITDRSFGWPGQAAKQTYGWLHRHGLVFDSVTFTSDKTIAAVDMMIDDKIENYDVLDNSCDVYLLDRPWNQDDGSRRRITSLDQYVRLVLGE